MRLKLIFLLSWLVLTSTPAFAFWYGSTPIDGVELKGQPSAGSDTVQSLPKGTRFSAVDKPFQGFYRVRTSTTLGWIEASFIEMQNPNAPKLPPRTAQGQPQRQQRNARAPRENFPKWQIRGFVNLSSYTSPDIDDKIGTNDLHGGTGLGAEVAYRFTKKWAGAFRFESLGKSVAGFDDNLNTDYTFSVKSLSFTVGPDYYLAENKVYSVRLSGRVGMSKATFSAMATDLDLPNESSYSATVFTGLIILNGDYNLGAGFSIGANAGYRLLKTAELQPTVLANGSNVFGADPNYTPIGINLSGPFIGLNLNFAF